MTKPTKKQITYARSVIATMRAFIAGHPLQYRGAFTTRGQWVTFDLAKFIDAGPLEYRVKPTRKGVKRAQASR